jgi:hypothetical protein
MKRDAAEIKKLLGTCICPTEDDSRQQQADAADQHLSISSSTPASPEEAVQNAAALADSCLAIPTATFDLRLLQTDNPVPCLQTDHRLASPNTQRQPVASEADEPIKWENSPKPPREAFPDHPPQTSRAEGGQFDVKGALQKVTIEHSPAAPVIESRLPSPAPSRSVLNYDVLWQADPQQFQTTIEKIKFDSLANSRMTVNSFRSDSDKHDSSILPRLRNVRPTPSKTGSRALLKAASGQRVAEEAQKIELSLPPPLQAVSSLSLPSSQVPEKRVAGDVRQPGDRVSWPPLQYEASDCLLENRSRCRLDLSSVSAICLDQRNPLSVDTSFRHLSLLDTSRLREEVRIARFDRKIGQVRPR